MSMLCLPHQKILEDQIPLAARQWSAATTALYLAINCIGSGLDFDDAIKCVAGLAMERGWLVRNHDMPPTLVLLLLGLTYIPIDTVANNVMRLSLGTVTLPTIRVQLSPTPTNKALVPSPGLFSFLMPVYS